MTTALDEASSASLIAPTEAAWRALSPAERERYLLRVLDALSSPGISMSEGRPQKKAKSQALDALGLYFRSLGRDVYLGEEMAVVYAGEAPFSPDLLAVVDVVEPEDDQRLAWVVADEGRGLDGVLEVLHRGDRKKDLVDNVERYAALGIRGVFRLRPPGREDLRLAPADAQRPALPANRPPAGTTFLARARARPRAGGRPAQVSSTGRPSSSDRRI